jgi:hypothetical protein
VRRRMVLARRLARLRLLPVLKLTMQKTPVAVGSVALAATMATAGSSPTPGTEPG